MPTNSLRRTRRAQAAGALVVLLGLTSGLTACGDDAKVEKDTTTTTEKAKATTTTEATTTTTAPAPAAAFR